MPTLRVRHDGHRITRYGVDLARGEELFATLRWLIEQQELPDAPVDVTREGEASVALSSLHGGAMLAVSEEPRCRVVPWTPHPNATLGPRIAALLAERDAKKRSARHAPTIAEPAP